MPAVGPTRTSCAAALLAGALLVAGCGDADDRPSVQTGAANQVDTAIVPDQELADRSVLRLEDLSSGWQLQPPAPAPAAGGDDVPPGLEACEDPVAGRELAAAESPLFGKTGDGTFRFATSSATVFPDAPTAIRMVEAVRRPEAAPCFTKLLKSALHDAGDQTRVDGESEPDLTIPTVGDQSAFFAGTYEVALPAGPMTFETAVAVIRVDRVTTMLVVGALNGDMPRAGLINTAERLAERMSGTVTVP